MGYPYRDRGVSNNIAVTKTAAKSMRVFVNTSGRAEDTVGVRYNARTAIRGARIRLGQKR